MRFLKAQNSRGTFVLATAGLVATLACAGTGLTGALAPLLIPKPNSFQTAQGDLASVDMDEIAPRLNAIEPASLTPRALPPAAPVKSKPFSFFHVFSLSSVSAPKPIQHPFFHAVDPLTDQDAALYRQIFSAQAAGDWAGADKLIAQLTDLQLRGHVLFQRYTHPSYQASFAELKDWLVQYNDEPGADRIFKLATARQPKDDASVLPLPRNQIGVNDGVLDILSTGADSYSPDKDLTPSQQKKIDGLTAQIKSLIGQGAPTRALNLLNQAKNIRLLDNAEYDQLRAYIASGYLLLGKTAEARSLASASAGRSGQKAPLSGWVAGLSAWRQKDYPAASGFFEQTARSPYNNSWTRSAGAYWASRAHLRAGDAGQVTPWLKEAARHPRTFYGLIATQALGWDYDFNWSTPEFTRTHFNTLVQIPAACRAMALVQAGQNHLAEAELVQINADQDPQVKDALLAYTQKANLPSLAMRMAGNTVKPDGGLYDAALYPLLPWQPRDGYSVDRALIYAIIRQESRFNTWAESPSGAVGLMQLMPTTASYVAGSDRFTDKAGQHHLQDPEMNLELGQKYIARLLEQDGVDNDLMSLAVAYNAGPGNLHKWKRDLKDVDDPLLFLEMIPIAETRSYAQHVLANYWIYGLRLGRPMESLQAMAEGKWPSYVPLEQRRATHFAAAKSQPAPSQSAPSQSIIVAGN